MFSKCLRFKRYFGYNITLNDIEQVARKNNAVIIDVRNHNEYQEQHINNAINIPLNEIKNIVPVKFPNKSQCFIVYCSSGVRSKKAQYILNKMEYKCVFNVLEGI